MNEAAARTSIVKACQNALNMDIGKAGDIAFHMTDWLHDLEQFHSFIQSPESLDEEQVADLLISFLVHVPNHIAAAAKLATGIGVADIFEVGAMETEGNTPD